MGEEVEEKLWLITASVGEYSDRSEWSVCVLEDEAQAKAFCDELSAASRQVEDAVRRWRDTPEYLSSEYDDEQAKEAELAEPLLALGVGWSDYCGRGPTFYCGEVPIVRKGRRLSRDTSAEGK